MQKVNLSYKEMDTWGGDATVHMSREGGCNPIHDLFCMNFEFPYTTKSHHANSGSYKMST